MGYSSFESESKHTTQKMMKLFLAFAILFAASEAKLDNSEDNYILSDEFIAETNRLANGQWTAERSFDSKTPTSYFQNMLGLLPDNDKHLPPLKYNMYTKEQLDAIPFEFDPRVEWPECPSLSMIWDQGGCGSCWAFGAANAMSDRLCIHSENHEVKTLVSPHELVSCCTFCGFGCDGGWSGPTWEYWHTNGIVSGGLYGDTETCMPYGLAPCEHHVDGDRGPCGDESTPSCHQECQSGYPTEFTEDKSFGKAHYTVQRNEKEIQMELMTNGPTEVSFTVYEDFVNYKSGVYQHTHGMQLGGHAVRMLGWGEENGTPYWLIANSWNTDWGHRGTFKILRGQNECGIEGNVVAGMPEFSK